MQLLTAQIKPDSNIFLIGDVHEGARLLDDDGWDVFVEMLNSPYDGCTNNYYVDHGDSCEGILVNDKRFDQVSSRDSRTLKQMDAAVERRKKIAKKCVAWMNGNHEQKLSRIGDIVGRMCKELNIPYVGENQRSAKVIYRHNGNVLFKGYHCHGNGTMNHMAGDEEQRQANMRVKLKRLLRFKAADTYLMSMGHTHKLLIRPPLIKLNLIDDSGKLKQIYDKTPDKFKQGDILHEDMRWYCNSGCFLKTVSLDFSSYSENYDPNILGFAVAIVRDGKLVNVREERI